MKACGATMAALPGGTLRLDKGETLTVTGKGGPLQVTRYDLKAEEDGGLFLFAQKDSVHATAGSAGALIPPYEYHVLANSQPDRIALTLHVYGGEMMTCHIFEPVDGDRYVRRERPLCYHD